jgi:hypothetical protein
MIAPTFKSRFAHPSTRRKDTRPELPGGHVGPVREAAMVARRHGEAHETEEDDEKRGSHQRTPKAIA